MRFFLASVLVGLAMVSVIPAGEENLSGNWKVTITEDGQSMNFWLVNFESKDGKLAGKAISLKRVPPSTLSDLKVQGDLLTFTIRLENKVSFSFEGKLPQAGAKKIFGSLLRGSNAIPAVLEATPAKNQYELDRDLVTRSPNDPRVFSTVLDLLKIAKAEKAQGKDVQEWVEAALKASESYGPRWNGDISLRLLEAMTGDYSEQVVNLGQKLEAKFDAKTPVSTQIRLLNILATAMRKSGQADQAKGLDTRIDKLEGVAYAEHLKTNLDFQVEKFKGRKKGNRTVLVELFTGTQCPPCVAADIGFDAVEKTYKGSDVILLQYHLHIPGPDPLTSPDSESRQEYYHPAVKGTPALLFNGKTGAPGGGGKSDAEEKYKEYRTVIDPLLEKDAAVKVAVQAVRKGDKIHIKASAQELEKPGEKIRLRLALVEDWVGYKSPNGLAYHHRVVRAFPGGVKGTAMVKNELEVSEVVDIEALQTKLNRYLDDFAAKEEPFPDAQRPLRLRDLHVIAFVQNDANNEILQAAEAPVREE